MNLSEMRQLLATRGIQLTKSLGQNFLHDGNQLRRIVAAAELRPTDRVLEVGPGLGPLTELLLAEAGEVLAIELDARLCALLQERFAGQPKLRLLNADALGFIRSDLMVDWGRGRLVPANPVGTGRPHPEAWAGWKVVSNLPYSIASPLLVELALAKEPPDRVVVTLQYEVAKRLVAGAGDDDYGLLSLLMQLRFEPRGLFKIPAGCFFPEPEVESACVTLVRREPELLPPELHPDFKRLVKLAFSQRRKMMPKLLKQQWPADRLAAVLGELGISPQVRAEAVRLDQFVELTRRLHE